MKNLFLIYFSLIVFLSLLLSCKMEDEINFIKNSSKINYESEALGNKERVGSHKSDISNLEQNDVGDLSYNSNEKDHKNNVFLLDGKNKNSSPDATTFEGDLNKDKKSRKKLLLGISPLTD